MIKNITLLKKHTKIRIALLGLSLLLGIQLQSVAQGVGINTTTPDPSAALHIKSSNSGLLLPQVSLQSVTDKVTVPNPAHGLLVYNTNAGLDGKGLYYNSGTSQLPNWFNVNWFKFPFYYATESTQNIFHIENYGGISTTSAIRGYSSGSGTGIYAQNDGIGNALIVDGKLKIFGTNQAPGAGKVLTSDNNGNATWQAPSVTPKIAFKASGVKGGGSEKIAVDFETKIPFAIENYDLNNNYTNANSSPHSTFIAPIAGIYHFDVKLISSMLDEGNPDSQHDVQLNLKKEVNGVATTVAYESSHGSQSLFFNNLSADIQLNIGEKIYVVVYQLNGDYVYLDTQESHSYFSGHLVTPL